MEQWTDKAIKQHIEDLIEESYLLSLSDIEMREYFRDFIDACDHVLRTTISINDDLKTVRIRMALLKARLLVDQNSVIVVQREGKEGRAGTDHDLFARQIITTKRAILRFFELLDHTVAQAVLDETTRRKTLKEKESHRKRTLENGLVTVGYYLLLAGVIVLTLYVGYH